MKELLEVQKERIKFIDEAIFWSEPYSGNLVMEINGEVIRIDTPFQILEHIQKSSEIFQDDVEVITE